MSNSFFNSIIGPVLCGMGCVGAFFSVVSLISRLITKKRMDFFIFFIRFLKGALIAAGFCISWLFSLYLNRLGSYDEITIWNITKDFFFGMVDLAFMIFMIRLPHKITQHYERKHLEKYEQVDNASPKAPPKEIPKQADAKTFILWALILVGIAAVIIALAVWGLSCLS